MSGFPDVDSYNTYDGHKENYAAVEDPTTDRDALKANLAYLTTSAMSHTASRCWVRLVCAATTGALSLAVTNGNDAGWPSGTNALPTLLRNGTGDFTITWPATIIDEDGGSHALNLRAARCTIEGATFGFATAQAATPNSVRVRLATTAGAANDFVGTTIFIEGI